MDQIIKRSPSLHEAQHILKIHILIFTLFLVAVLLQTIGDLLVLEHSKLTIATQAFVYVVIQLVALFFSLLIWRFNEKKVDVGYQQPGYFSWLSYLRFELC